MLGFDKSLHILTQPSTLTVLLECNDQFNLWQDKTNVLEGAACSLPFCIRLLYFLYLVKCILFEFVPIMLVFLFCQNQCIRKVSIPLFTVFSIKSEANSSTNNVILSHLRSKGKYHSINVILQWNVYEICALICAYISLARQLIRYMHWYQFIYFVKAFHKSLKLFDGKMKLLHSIYSHH